MENQNTENKKDDNKKQLILIILCIFVLIVGVIGVSVAFFSFFKEGSTDNIITTGKIVFNFDDNDTTGKVDPDTGEITPGDLIVTNDEPMEDKDGKAREDKFGFDVDAKIPTNADKEVEFRVYVIAGDPPSAEKGYQKPDGSAYTEKDRLDYKYISMYVEPNTKKTQNASDIEDTIVTKYKTGDYKLEDTTEGKKVLIASGKIPGDNVEHIYAYMLSMWINKDLTVSDTDIDAAYRASATTSGLLPKGQDTDERKVYSDMYFSLKIRIEAGDTVGIGG